EPVDGRLTEFAKKVEVVEDPALTAESPQKRVAVVTVRTADGKVRSARVDYAKGDPENPMTEAELAEKKRSLTAYAADRGQTPSGHRDTE
ncbi:MAG: MmgE/PrpD family protein, partial [Clostridia bacterium]|nr:MmgE/PrpD family protein [Clostridia bacterium]